MTECPISGTRDEALERLNVFASRLEDGEAGPSGLGPYLRCRLISEREAARSILSRLRVGEAERFLTQLLWGSYWKGWLEGRPQIYTAYRRLLSQDRRRWGALESYRAAIESRTGIPAFDAWNQQLTRTGCLTHQMRMWYASVWIFTLRLPWTLGANHFFRHLLDGDIASNTLNWRWVGGLQPPGRHYLAQADEIEAFGDGRYLTKGRLNVAAAGLKGPPIAAARPWLKLPRLPSSLLGERFGLLITPKDLSVEKSALSTLRPQMIVLAGLDCLEDQEWFAPKVSSFLQEAVSDAKVRLAAHFQCPIFDLRTDGDPAQALTELLGGEDIASVCYLQPPTGPWLELLHRMTSRDVGLKYFPVRRRWDSALFPHATKSFLQFKDVALPLLHGLLKDL